MSKDKKKKKKAKTSDGAIGASAPVAAKPTKAKQTKKLKAISENPLVADVVAAALVAMASALRDSNKARELAASAGDELSDMAKSGAEQGSAMWQLALDVGRRTLETLSDEHSGKSGKAK